MRYNWGFGLELERMVFTIENDIYCAVDIDKLFKHRYNTPLLDEELDLLDKLPHLERSGRHCVITIDSLMFEIVTTFPLNNKVEEVIYELNDKSRKLLQIFSKIHKSIYNTDQKLVYSKISTLQFKDIDGTIKFSNTGSLHINITLPHKKDVSDKDYLKLYQTYIHQFHWLEPIIYSLLTSGNYKSIDSEQYVKCCYRLSIGWGIAGGTDINRLNQGQPRMVSILPDYINHINKKEIVKNTDENCLISRSYYDSYTTGLEKSPLFTDIATIYKENPLEFMSDFIPQNLNDKLQTRGFKKGYGIEFRLFDELQPKYIIDIIRFLVYLGENSYHLINKKKDYIYHNSIWNQHMLNVLNDGYQTHFSTKYIDLINDNIGINIKPQKYQSSDLMNLVNKHLFNKYNNGIFSQLMFSKNYQQPPIFYNMNKHFIDYFKKKLTTKNNKKNANKKKKTTHNNKKTTHNNKRTTDKKKKTTQNNKKTTNKKRKTANKKKKTANKNKRTTNNNKKLL